MSQGKPPTAISGKGDSAYEEEFRAIGQILRRDGKQIVDSWFERATKEQVHASPDERAEAMNDLLKTLRAIGRRLEEQSGNALEVASEIAQSHGRQRSKLGWDITHVVRDYEILHGVVLEHLGEVLSERLTFRQAMTIASVMDRASGSSVQAFSEMTNGVLESQVKHQQAELRQLILDLTEAEHSERQRIAQILHDDFQQILVATRMKLQSVMRAPSPDPAGLQGMQDLLDQMLDASRDLSRQLHPAMLDTTSLPAAIESLAKYFHERHSLTVTVDLQVPKEANPGPMPLRRLIYNGVRELLFNVVKHGKTAEAWVRVSETAPSRWRFEVEDRGAGFSRMETDEPAAPTGLGLSSLQHRIEQVGGSAEVDSEHGRGTRIWFEVPMETEETQEKQSE